MSSRLDQEREARLQPKRMSTALQKLKELGTVVVTYSDDTTIKFLWMGHECCYYPYSGWASGKTVKNGRGLENLLKQLK